MPTSQVFLQGPFKVDFKKAWPTADERRARGREARAPAPQFRVRVLLQR
jgi:hypothetical protein